MKASVLFEYNKPLKIVDVKVDKPKKDEVLLKIIATGVCHSDLHVLYGKTPVPLPVVLGHEFIASVEEVGEGVTTINKGDVVISSFIWPCGVCINCTTGRENLCETAALIRLKGVMLDGTTRLSLPNGESIHTFLGGGYAEYAVVPKFAIYRLPPELKKESSAILGCAVLTAYGAVFNAAQVRLGEKVAIFGATGGVGMNILEFCKIAGAGQIIALGRQTWKLSVAKELGATDIINLREKDPVKEIKELTGGKGADVVFEAIGLPDTIYQAIEATKVGGRVILIGLMPIGSSAPIHVAKVVRSGIQIMGSYGGRPRLDFPIIFDLAKKGLLNIDRLVTKKFTLDQVNEAFEALEKGEVIRSILIP